MSVILALLNDVPIMMIAYDNVKIQEKPVRWNMRDVLVVASFARRDSRVRKFLFIPYRVASVEFRHGYSAYNYFT